MKVLKKVIVHKGKEMSKYDFYDRFPKTKSDIKEYLTTWIESIEPNGEVSIDNESWIIVAGFRRGFCAHNVMVNMTTHEYAFHAAEDFDFFPNMGKYATYEDMLEGVANRYAVLWDIDEK